MEDATIAPSLAEVAFGLLFVVTTAGSAWLVVRLLRRRRGESSPGS